MFEGNEAQEGRAGCTIAADGGNTCLEETVVGEKKTCISSVIKLSASPEASKAAFFQRGGSL